MLLIIVTLSVAEGGLRHAYVSHIYEAELTTEAQSCTRRVRGARGVQRAARVFGSRLSARLFTDSGVPWLYRGVGRLG